MRSNSSGNTVVVIRLILVLMRRCPTWGRCGHSGGVTVQEIRACRRGKCVAQRIVPSQQAGHTGGIGDLNVKGGRHGIT